MKKKTLFILFVILTGLLVPFVVRAEECSLDNISIEKIEILNKSESAVQKLEPVIDGKKLIFDIKLDEVGSFIEYKMIIKNDTDKDYELDSNYNNEYFNYMISTEDKSNVIKKNETKEVLLRVSYMKTIPEELLNDDNVYSSNTHLVMAKSNDVIINPATGNMGTILFLLFVICLFILSKRYHKNSLLLLLFLLLLFTSFSVYAVCNLSIDIEAKIELSTLTDGYVYTINKYDENVGTSSYVWLDKTISKQIIKYNTGTETGKNIYLKHKLVNKKVEESYVEFNVTEEMESNNPGVKKGSYSLRGSVFDLLVDNYRSPYYEDNLEILKQAFGENTNYCVDEGSYFVCSISGLYVYVDSNGCVGANDSSWYCDFYYDGNSACFE